MDSSPKPPNRLTASTTSPSLSRTSYANWSRLAELSLSITTTSIEVRPPRSMPTASLVNSMVNVSVPSASSSSSRLIEIVASRPPWSKVMSPDAAVKSSPCLAVPSTVLYWTVTGSCTFPERMTLSSYVAAPSSYSIRGARNSTRPSTNCSPPKTRVMLFWSYSPTRVNWPPNRMLPSGCSATVNTGPLAPSPGSKLRSSSPL